MLLLQGFNNRLARRKSYSGLASSDKVSKRWLLNKKKGSIDSVTMFNTNRVSSLFVIEVRLPLVLTTIVSPVPSFVVMMERVVSVLEWQLNH